VSGKRSIGDDTTEQPPSVEAMTLLSEIIGSCGKAGICHSPPCACAESIDALIAQRVSAETERCAEIAEDLALDIRDAIRAQGKQL